MAKKGYKIKRYSNIYRKNRNSRIGPLGIVLTVLAVLLLVFIGWSLYGPVYNFLTGNIKAPQTSSSVSEDIPPAFSSSSEDEQSEPENENTEQDTGYTAAVLDAKTASDSDSLKSFIEDIKSQGYDSAVIEIKDDEGNVLYNTSNKTVASLNTVSDDAFDLKAVCGELKKNEIKPIVQINAFKDHAAASAMPDAAVRYKPDTSYFWADDAPKNGGKYWLNPNSEKAQDYILAIIDDALDMGASAVILDRVQFPEGYSLNLCDFGDMTSKEQVLENFIKSAEQKTAEKGVPVFFKHPVSKKYLSDNDQYGVSPLKIEALNVVFDLSEIGDDIGDIEKTVKETAAGSQKRESIMVLLPKDLSGADTVKMLADTIKSENVNGIIVSSEKQS